MRYELPRGEIFRTQHSGDRNWEIANYGLILLSEIGSTMHGVSSDDTGDDIDLMGICIEPPVEVLGLGDFEQYEYRDRAVNERSQEGDTDLVVYGLRKWVKLAADGNPRSSCCCSPIAICTSSSSMALGYCCASSSQCS